jgi:hypothetical protein
VLPYHATQHRAYHVYAYTRTVQHARRNATSIMQRRARCQRQCPYGVMRWSSGSVLSGSSTDMSTSCDPNSIAIAMLLAPCTESAGERAAPAGRPSPAPPRTPMNETYCWQRLDREKLQETYPIFGQVRHADADHRRTNLQKAVSVAGLRPIPWARRREAIVTSFCIRDENCRIPFTSSPMKMACPNRCFERAQRGQREDRTFGRCE